MQFTIKDVEDLRWLLGHTGGFRGGYVTNVQMAKRRLFDEGSGREVLADTVVTVVVRYHLRQMERVTKLTMKGVTDFSIFELGPDRTIEADELWTRHRTSAYVGRKCRARITDTYVRGTAVYAAGRLVNLSQPGKFLRPAG